MNRIIAFIIFLAFVTAIMAVCFAVPAIGAAVLMFFGLLPAAAFIYWIVHLIIKFVGPLIPERPAKQATPVKKAIPSHWEEIQKSAECLAETAVSTVEALRVAGSEYLGHSQLTLADSAVFACFVVRCLVIPAANRDAEKLAAFDSAFLPASIRSIASQIGPVDTAKELFDDRTHTYDRAVLAQGNNGTEAIAQELQSAFQRIIHLDIDNGSYAPYYMTSPVLLTDIFQESECASEISAFVQTFIQATEAPVRNAVAALRT